MYLVKIKVVSDRQETLQQITVKKFNSIRADLPELLDMLLLVDAALDLRISELLVLQRGL